MHPQPVLSLPFTPARKPATKALAFLPCKHPAQVRAEAEREVAEAPRCGCCVTARVHLVKYVGSTLFLDDDPEQLQLAFPASERAEWTPR